MIILQTTTIDLDTKQKIYTANVGRDARDLTHLYASMQDRTELLSSMTERRPLTTREALGTTHGVRIFA